MGGGAEAAEGVVRKCKKNLAIEAVERRKTILHVLTQARMWMSIPALRHYVTAKRQVVEQDLERLAERGEIEVGSLKTYDPELDCYPVVKIARSVKTEARCPRNT